MLGLAVLLQLVLAMIYYRPEPKGLVGDEPLYLASASASADDRPDPDPLRAPLYARLLALLGVSASRRWPIQLLQLSVFATSVWLLRRATRRLVGSRRAGDLAAALALLYPTLGAFSYYLWPEILHLGLWLAAFTLLACWEHRAGWLVVAGLSIAAAISLRHLLLGFLPLILVALWIDERQRHGRGIAASLRSLAWLAAPVVLVVAPLLATDRAADGTLHAASSARFNLWVGLNDPSAWSDDRPIAYREYRAYLDSSELPRERDHLLVEKTTRLLESQGWGRTLYRQLGKQYFRLLDERSFFVAQLPGGAMHDARQGYRGPGPVLATALRWLDHLVYALLLTAFAWGLWRVPWSGDRGAPIWLWLALAFLIYNLALFTGLHARSRYFLQMVPFVAPFAAAGLAGWLRGPGLDPMRRAAATVLSALLLLLAFGPAWLG